MRLLYIDIDSCRPDHLGCYGYHRNTTPHIDALAREGMIFRQCYTADAPCLPSRTALYSGRFGIQTGVVGHGGSAANPKIQGAGRGFRDWFDEQGLARQLQKLGLHTAMISPFGQRHAAHWFYAGFNEIHNTGQCGMESAEEVWPVTDEWLRRRAAGDSWFLHVNLWDPHTPYRAPAGCGHPFKDDPLPAWLADPAVLARHQRMTGPHTALDVGMYDDRVDPRYALRQPGALTDQAQLRRLIDGYDTGVRYADDFIGRMVAQLKAAGVYDETAIIVSADHGENLGELGIYAEHGTADAATCRIPLVVKWPGGARGSNDRLHYNIDLAPTLMEMLGGECQPLWAGLSFAAALRPGDQGTGRDELVLSQCAHVCQRSVRFGPWLYLRTYHDGHHLFPPEMLFDLEQDPHEQHDLTAARPELCREGAWRLARWHDAQMQEMAHRAGDVVDPLWTVMREGGPFHARSVSPGNPEGGRAGLQRYIERLKKTGRADGAARLAERLGDGGWQQSVPR
ncbi:MAG: sulfatase [Verrucomicrobiota bacterium]